jgi:hypothetical protein
VPHGSSRTEVGARAKRGSREMGLSQQLEAAARSALEYIRVVLAEDLHYWVTSRRIWTL